VGTSRWPLLRPGSSFQEASTPTPYCLLRTGISSAWQRA
jgi:hypothetical protein